MPGTCGAVRVNEVDSIAVGPQQVPYTCTEPATELVHVGGQTFEMCHQCASDLLKREADAKSRDAHDNDVRRLQEISGHMSNWADDFERWPEVAAWFRQAAGQLAAFAQGQA